MELIGITSALAISGCTDFSWCDEESKWKGSEVHRVMELRLQNRLDIVSVPEEMRGYLAAIEKFMRETSFIPTHIEFKVQDRKLGCRGRIDAAGLLRGKLTIVDFKSGQISPAVALQLCLGGHMLDSSHWWQRIAVRLQPDGNYSLGKDMPILEWHSDLVTAQGAVRLSQWKIRHGLFKK